MKNNGQKLLSKTKYGTARNGNAPALTRMRKQIVWQAGLAVMTIVLTLVIVFAMTAAWYTNIIQTSGLVFEAEAWGFDGTIQVASDPIKAGPGDDDIIQLEIANNNQNTTAVTVNVSKTRMVAEMQKRLYFYVDTQLTRNDETMTRVYLNSQEGYTYTLFNQGDLILTEEIHNGPQLRWQWVYDVLGYYVLGSANSDRTDVTELEYLRPIEYDYDQATIVTKTETINNNEVVTMEIATVDGEHTPEEFLEELSASDGYAGVIDTEKAIKVGDYYPVDVDEEGYGVYAYLCSYTDIEMANRYDTAVGEAAAAVENQTQPEGETSEPLLQPVLYEAQLLITAQKNKNSIINVSTLAALETAMELGTADVIQLSGNITLSDTESVTISGNRQVMLDLNGKTITCNGTDVAVQVEEGSSLTMVNGTLASSVGTTNAVCATGAEVVLSNVKIQGFTDSIRIADDAGDKGMDSKVRLIGCDVDAKSYAIIVKGNGSQSERPTQLIVENSTITSDGVAIGGNGSLDQSGTDIQILNSTIKGNADKVSTAIFHPQDGGTLTVYRSVVSGYTGIAIKGGHVSIIDSTVEGTGEKMEPAFYGSGCADTGDAIYIETNYGYKILLEISEDSDIRASKSYSLQVYKPDADNVTVRIYSGDFDEPQPASYIAEGSEQTGSTVKVKTEATEETGTQ